MLTNQNCLFSGMRAGYLRAYIHLRAPYLIKCIWEKNGSRFAFIWSTIRILFIYRNICNICLSGYIIIIIAYACDINYEFISIKEFSLWVLRCVRHISITIYDNALLNVFLNTHTHTHILEKVSQSRVSQVQ